MNAKHTPGPWIVEPMPGLSGLVRVVGRANNAAQTPLEVAGNLSAGNANLIAAAPEMYEELERLSSPRFREGLLATYCGGHHYDGQLPAYQHGMDTVCNVLEGELKAVLAKARGEVIS